MRRTPSMFRIKYYINICLKDEMYFVIYCHYTPNEQCKTIPSSLSSCVPFFLFFFLLFLSLFSLLVRREIEKKKLTQNTIVLWRTTKKTFFICPKLTLWQPRKISVGRRIFVNRNVIGRSFFFYMRFGSI